MEKQVDNGKAFEYACLVGLEKTIRKYGQKVRCQINSTKTFEKAKTAFNELPSEEHKEFLMLAAENAANKLKDLEPRLIYPVDVLNDTIVLTLQSDSAGEEGDVRDVLAIRILLKSKKAGWEMGLSCKHNHYALKHQRISPDINIGEKWMGHSSEPKYFEEINRIFNKIAKLSEKGIENWSQIDDKETVVYEPIMEAVKNEIERVCKSHKDACGNLLAYLIGKDDFYKIIVETSKKSVSIRGFNFNGTLNKSADNEAPKDKTKKLKLPSRLKIIEFKEDKKNTIELTMDQGWCISMRIHNAATEIENSLKLDVQIVGLPDGLYTQDISI